METKKLKKMGSKQLLKKFDKSDEPLQKNIEEILQLRYSGKEIKFKPFRENYYIQGTIKFVKIGDRDNKLYAKVVTTANGEFYKQLKTIING